MSRALVLGGGGPVGIAWESGLIAGLAQGGVDLGRADFTMGTSAGSFVGASFGRSFAGLPDDAWPERDFACTAVDAETGAFTLWTKASGVGVVRAVASSCSVPGVFPPVTLNGRHYIDGGMRSPTNADMAQGHTLVMLIAIRVSGAVGAFAERMSAQLDEEIESLKEGGSVVLTVTPDDASAESFGPNLMDFSRRAGAARAGLAQGLAYAADVKPYWG